MPDGHAVVATFAPGGPDRYSVLPQSFQYSLSGPVRCTVWLSRQRRVGSSHSGRPTHAALAQMNVE
jgi:hypothetical protein